MVIWLALQSNKRYSLKIDFTKYHGAGNDFVMINNLTGWLATELMTPEVVARLCRRHFGIGADGLIILAKNPEAEFEMIYYNSDGHPSSMCGQDASPERPDAYPPFLYAYHQKP